jgi:hypothetical protein
MLRILTIEINPSPLIKWNVRFSIPVLFSQVMKGIVSVLLLLICCTCAAQKVQTIVPDQPVVVGTAFQVQYVITDPGDYISSTAPVFEGCRLVSGPNLYKGNAVVDGRLQPIQNIAFTLVPVNLGELKIGSIKVSFKNAPEANSDDAVITVVPQPKASFLSRSSYTDVNLYAPASKTDRDKLIEDNLFIKTIVDKRVCYEGEPITATFKLYSRLQSSSEAEKSPAFYGFSVLDVLNINEAHTAVETVKGKVFNTSVLRQVQLYPVQAGQLTIDPMYVQNEIEFDDTLNHRRTTVEKEIVTQPVAITVKPLPAKKPDDYSGAVGSFALEAHLEKTDLPINHEGRLVVTIKGKGNFIQAGPPVIQWPNGTEAFDPVLIDKLNKNAVPIEGTRRYEFGFAANAVGTYLLPPVSFSFFDLSTRAFKTITTDTLLLQVREAKKLTAPKVEPLVKRWPYVWILLTALTGSLALFLWLRNKRNKPQPPAPETSQKPNYTQQLAALNLNELTEEQFCLEIQKILSAFSTQGPPLLSAQQKAELRSILKDCELCIYSHFPTTGKEDLIKRALKVLQSGSTSATG